VIDAFRSLEEAIRTGDTEGGASEAVRLVQAGAAPLAIFQDCIQPCLQEIGDQFSRLEVFLPEMMEAADVVKAIQQALQPYLKSGEAEQASKGRIVIGTIQGDLHDIGKNIVRTLLEVNGYQVRDVGVDVAPTEMIRAARDFDARIIAISALMLPSLPYVRDAIEMLRSSEANRGRFKVMVGGGPVSRDWARHAGADGYGDDAMDAVKQAAALMAA
jgi:methylmalonyl-CoA mutase cobalamin-binding domain/chain